MQDQAVPDAGLRDRDIVHVRWLAADDQSSDDLPALHRLLNAAEQARAARFYAEHDRRSYIMAHALTRLMLSSCLNVTPQALRFRTGHHGKPELAMDGDATMLRFNLSHTRGMVAVALAWGKDVGVDVERIEKGRLSLDLAAKAFATAEADYLARLPASAQTEVALTLWTLKEAYIKATGLGLSCPLNAFAFTLDPLGIRFFPPLADDPANWHFQIERPSPLYALAVAVRSAGAYPVQVDARGLSWQNLLKM